MLETKVPVCVGDLPDSDGVVEVSLRTDGLAEGACTVCRCLDSSKGLGSPCWQRRGGDWWPLLSFRSKIKEAITDLYKGPDDRKL